MRVRIAVRGDTDAQQQRLLFFIIHLIYYFLFYANPLPFLHPRSLNLHNRQVDEEVLLEAVGMEMEEEEMGPDLSVGVCVVETAYGRRWDKGESGRGNDNTRNNQIDQRRENMTDVKERWRRKEELQLEVEMEEEGEDAEERRYHNSGDRIFLLHF
jgi:hypothetical protein